MSQSALIIDNLSKRYRLGAGPQGKGDFRDVASRALGGVKRRLTGGGSRDRAEAGEDQRELWALKDVSFEVPRGSVMGLIGHNGAGKSTLLKILSRITDPTTGRAEIDGRVGSLLEVGTGFHPELTGRENIYLNGSILGMTRREINDKFDQILAFSEIGRFLDTPVKRYSSGMYVRLAFAVAAHLEPEILVIDEVLAVGDAAFQRKCLEKMQELAGGGRTILFVSHNMSSIQTLCHAAIVMHRGQMLYSGGADDAVQFYLKHASESSGIPLKDRPDRRGRGNTRLQSIRVYPEGKPEADGLLVYGQPARIEVTVDRLLPDMHCSFTILNHITTRVARFASRVTTPQDTTSPGNRYVLEVPEWTMIPGRYHVNVSLFSAQGAEDEVDMAASFEVAPGTIDDRPLAREQTGVIIAPRHRWETPAA
jgi:lipopolysaccharide transport system ATP-binding protein